MFTIVRMIVDDCSAPQFNSLIGLFATRELAQVHANTLPTARTIVDGYAYYVVELDEIDLVETPKTDAYREAAARLGLDVIDVPLSFMDEGDVRGVPIPPPDEDEVDCKACGNPIDEHEPGQYDDECQYRISISDGLDSGVFGTAGIGKSSVTTLPADLSLANPWDDDATYPSSDWQSEVENGDTRLGYLDWVANQREMNA